MDSEPSILDSEPSDVQHKHTRWEAFRKIVEKLRKDGPCWPREIYNDTKLGLSKSTVFHGLKLGIHTGVMEKLEDGRYDLKGDRSSSETITLLQPQPGEVKLCISGLEAKYNPERYKANLHVLKTFLHLGHWDNDLDDFFFKALKNPEEYEEEIDRLLHAVPRNREKIEFFFKSKRDKISILDKIYDLVKISDRLGSSALCISVDVSNGKEVLVWMENDLEGEGAEKVLKAALGYGWKLHEKFNYDFREFLQKALDHKNEKVRQHASSLISETYYT